MIEFAEYQRLMQEKGWVVFDGLISSDVVTGMAQDIEAAYEACRQIQIDNDIPENNEYTVHHLIGQGESFMACLDEMKILQPHIEDYFGGKYILNSFGGAINTCKSSSYAHAIHRDVRSFSKEMPLVLNTLVMIDEFTPENGATWLMKGGHNLPEKPDKESFFASAEQTAGKAGSVLMFNSNCWHCAGDNVTDKPRRSVTPMFCRPFLKQQFDYPRAVGYENMDGLSEYQRQVLGYYSRIPATLSEWYQPPEKRMYRPGQG